MKYNSENPLIVQSDMTMLLEVDSPLYEEVRDSIAPFSEIVKTPEYVHTYRITPLSLWNAASAGLSFEEIAERLKRYSKYEVSQPMLLKIKDILSRYGKVLLERYDEKRVILRTSEPLLLRQFLRTDSVSALIESQLSETEAIAPSINRGLLKQALIKLKYPVVDSVGYSSGGFLDIAINTERLKLRDYQTLSVESFYKGGSSLGGSGVVVLPCGAGKTIVGIGVMDRIKTNTLILTTGTTAARQWIGELLDKTNIREEQIGEYTGFAKQIRPITVTTYQILTHRKTKSSDFIHFNTLNTDAWGLIIYDEVHLLPAEVFRFTASLQAVRRLGLTATLVREDGREDDVFALIGPKFVDIPWKELESQGWIAVVNCFEIRVPMPEEEMVKYVTADQKSRFRIASENPRKLAIIEKLIEENPDENILIIGQYLEQLDKIAEIFNFPLITGKTPQKVREELYREFREGKRKVLVVSSVANFSIDLPDASMAIQVSGKFGSRQEEAQRLGRILRPKKDGRPAKFFTLVSKDTVEQDFALKRHLFLAEQGYSYNLVNNL